MAYSQKEKDRIFEKILYEIAINGRSLTSITKDKDMIPKKTFFDWITIKEDDTEEIKKDKERKCNQYARSMEMRADYIFDELMEITDTTKDGKVIETDDSGRTKEKIGDMLGHRRLQVDTRKWALSKMNPKKYGDKIDHTTDGKEIKQQNIINLGGGKNPNEEN